MIIEKNKSLKKLNTFAINVNSLCYVEFSTLDELRTIFSDIIEDEKWHILGGGSNILYTKDYDGVVLHPINDGFSVVEQKADSVLIKVGSGYVWDDFVGRCVDMSLWGVENLSYIPGSVGASPVQNIGAYGVEVKDVVSSVEVYLPCEDKVVVLSNEDCRFGYRDSVFKQELKDKAVVLSVVFSLSLEASPNIRYGDVSKYLNTEVPSLRDIRNAIIAVRRQKLPDPLEVGNGGSFFKNPVVSMEVADKIIASYPDMPFYDTDSGVKIPAGWLIEQSGWKGYRDGDAGVHKNQALVLVNYGEATGSDIIGLSDRIRCSVKEKFGIEVTPEINII